uniref:MULE transposase domain-containing protein n=1 Tax=Ditylenchus dipsaci TaxID=166011 RepID=A0A915DNH9_9BILA
MQLLLNPTLYRGLLKFYQYFTLHEMIDDTFCVIGFSWMRSKSEKTFRRVFKKFFYLPAIEYCVDAFVSDFESGPSNVVLSIFPCEVAIRCIFDLWHAEQQWAKKHGMARFYVNGELSDWIILFSKLAYLPCKDVLFGLHALIREYERMVHNRIASGADDQRVTAFFKYIRTTYIYRGDNAQPRKPLYSFDLWNVNQHIIKQRPVTNNAVEAWNKEYKSHFPGGGKPDRSKVIRHQMDEKEGVRHAIIRHERNPRNLFELCEQSNWKQSSKFTQLSSDGMKSGKIKQNQLR